MGRIGDYERGGRRRPESRQACERRRANPIEPWLPLGELFPGRLAPRTWTPNRGGAAAPGAAAISSLADGIGATLDR